MSTRRRLLGGAGLAVSLVAGAVLIAYPSRQKPEPPGRVSLATAWPGAQRADIPGNLPDGPVYHPELFLDARTSVGTAPSPDATAMRLVVRGADGSLRELRRRPLDRDPEFGATAASGGDLV
ncbi:hypothetical protein AB0J80_21795 [Actinoplanes sp. NPDC049548]|uniref:hypothetical protein n=1 Tax=Actinoplanes sp. NPDC049548 TaxID=3155152 RepID=UPI00344180D1